MKKLSFILCFLLLVLFQACTVSEKTGSEILYKSVDFPKSLNLTCTQVELPAVVEMMGWCLDDSLLYFRSTDTEYFFYTFRLSDFSLVDSCGRKGQGPNEWLFPRMTTMPDGGLFIMDSSNKRGFYRMKNQEVTRLASCKNFDNVSDMQIYKYPLIGYMNFFPREVSWKLYDVEAGLTKDSIRYLDESNKGQALQQHEFFWNFAADDKVVLAHLYRDEYTVLQLKGDTINSVQICQGDDYTDSSNGFYYGDVECSDKYIFLLSHKRQTKSKRNATEVEVYDYQGNPVCLLKLGIAAQHMLLDRPRQRLLFLSPDDDYVYVANLDLNVK